MNIGTAAAAAAHVQLHHQVIYDCNLCKQLHGAHNSFTRQVGNNQAVQLYRNNHSAVQWYQVQHHNTVCYCLTTIIKPLVTDYT
jgi:hypothetical protein